MLHQHPAAWPDLQVFAPPPAHTHPALPSAALQCWGAAVGGGSIPASLTNSLGSNVVSVCGGDRIMAALRADGAAFSWGRYGDALYSDGNKAALIASGVSKLYCGMYIAAAIKTDGSIVAWGEIWPANVHCSRCCWRSPVR